MENCVTTVPPPQAVPPLVLALDLGTSSVRALVFDARARALGGLEARRPLTVPMSADGGAETDPDMVLDLLFACLDELLPKLGTLSGNLAAVGGCSLVGNLLGLDAAGNPLFPMSTYADTRAVPDADRLREILDPEAVHQRTGAFLHPSFHAAQLNMRARTEPERFARATHWVSLGEYLELRIFGAYAISHSTASWSGLLDRKSLTWDPEMLAAAGISAAQLSRPVSCAQGRRGLKPEFALRWPALANIPWFPLVGDGATANIGSDAATPASVALTMGTSSALRAVLPDPVARVPQGLFCYRVDETRALVGGALNEGGNLLTWLKQTLRLSGPEEIAAALTQRTPAKHGLTALPYLAGERSPGWTSHARGALHGLGLNTSAHDLAAALVEAAAYGMARVYERLKPLLAANHVVLAGGGALRAYPAVTQLLADVLGRPITMAAADEVSAKGAAILALDALGIPREAPRRPAPSALIVAPDMARHAIHKEAMLRQDRLYGLLVTDDDAIRPCPEQGETT